MHSMNFFGRRILAIVPHQDDEVIGMGGHLAHAARVASELNLVLVTDGAACGGVNRMLCRWDCRRLAAVGAGDLPLVDAHDAALVPGQDGPDAVRHAPGDVLPFDIADAPDRATNTFSAAWGKQRETEFLAVATTLGVRRAHITFAYWDPASPERIKDGQTAVDGRPLQPADMTDRFARVAAHYIARFQPEIVITMAPYEFMPPPNDHWACATGVERAAAGSGCVERVVYIHSGVHYQHIVKGGEPIGRPVKLGDDLWAIKQDALRQYMRWDPANGWFATAAHSVPETFAALFTGAGATEYASDSPVTGL